MTRLAPTDDLQRLRPLEVVWLAPDRGAPQEVVVDLAADTTVAELRAALGAGDGDLQVGQARVAGGTPVSEAGIARGACLGVPPSTADRSGAPPLLTLDLVAGLQAGRRWPLASGSHVVGRGPGCDIVIDAPTISARHAVLAVDDDATVTVTDLGSTNGCRIDGVFAQGLTDVPAGSLLQFGAVQAMLRPPARRNPLRGPRTADGTAAFNRPPRFHTIPPPPSVRLPAAPREPSPRARLAWAALLAPLVFGVAMALLVDPRFAMFALFSPVMMLGTWVEDRRRARRERREGRTQVDEGLAILRQELHTTADAARARARAIILDPAAAADQTTTSRLWERRPGHQDFLHLVGGVGAVPWDPPVTPPRGDVAPGVDEELARHRLLSDAPVTIDLSGAGVCGVAGDRAAAVALLRSLVVQAATSHGPADLRVAVLTQPERLADWDWVKWLPHARGAGGSAGACQLSVAPAAHDDLLAQVAGSAGSVTTLLVLDAERLTEGRNSTARDVLGAPGIAGLVYAPTVDRLPAACTTVVDLQGTDGAARCTDPRGERVVEQLLVAGVETDVARQVALDLAAVDDPEIVDPAGQLPQTVSLLGLLGLRGGRPTPQALLQRWQTGSRPVVPIGLTEQGPMVLDLAADGPHGLIAGTTGAGKSELLRSIVAGLAATVSPEELTFVLIDYKGGSAFDVCARLPHTVGLVTDLDEQLGERALQCLEAELRFRERVLREAGAADLDAYRTLREGDAMPALPSLPRLLVAVDEFATLAAELPDFIDRLVSVAQRGRSLGVHLLLATQRPAGAVSDNIRANTNLRIALRVQDAADSTDVIGSPVAADLTRRLPGRGYVRLGPGELMTFQAALATAASTVSAPRVAVRPFAAGVDGALTGSQHRACSDLELLVEAACAAFAQSGLAAPRRPWPQPLPGTVFLEDVSGEADRAGVVGLADDPQQQCQYPYRVDPREGNVLLYGVSGSGTSTALATIALALGHRDDVDCYVIDAGSQMLAPLAELPHVGAVIGAGDRERQERLVRFLTKELGARRGAVAGNGMLDPGTPTIVVLLDNYASFASGFDDLQGMSVLDAFARIVADGPALRMVVMASADRMTAVPPAVAATIPQRLVFRLPDRHDYASFGLSPVTVGELPPQRAVDAVTGIHVQIAQPAGSLEEAVAAFAGASRTVGPRPVDVMPARVALSDIVDAADLGGDYWFIPMGIGDQDLEPVGLRLGPGDHGLVTGPARSGKSTCLLTIATTVAKHRPDVRIAGVALRRSPLRECAYLSEVATCPQALEALMADLAEEAAPVLLLVDDADGTDDPGQAIAGVLTQRRDSLRVIGAGRADVLRSAYGHWTAELRRGRLGVALRPNTDIDGDLWHTPLPRGLRQPLPVGRGFLVADGMCELLQTADA